MSYGLGEGHRQLSTGIVVAEEDVGQGRSAFGAGIPGFEDGGDELVCPVDGERASVDEYQYDGLPRGLYGLKQLQLPARQVEAGARFVFAAGALPSAQYYDGNISLAGIFYGFVYLGLFVVGQRIVYDFTFGPVGVHQVTTFGVEHLCLAFCLFLNAFQHSGHLYGKGAVMGQRVAFFVGIGTTDGNLLGGVDV